MAKTADLFKYKWRLEVEHRKKIGTYPESLNHQVSKELEYLQALKKDGSLTFLEYLEECDQDG